MVECLLALQVMAWNGISWEHVQCFECVDIKTSTAVERCSKSIYPITRNGKIY